MYWDPPQEYSKCSKVADIALSLYSKDLSLIRTIAERIKARPQGGVSEDVHYSLYLWSMHFSYVYFESGCSVLGSTGS